MRFWRRKTFRWNFFQGRVFQSSVRFCSSAIRPDLCQYLYLPVFRAHVSVSPGFPWGVCFLGNLSRLGLRLVACSPPFHPPSQGGQRGVRASNGLLCSASPFRATLGRCFMPGLFASERLSAVCPIDLETVPFWASLSSGFGWFCMTTPQCTFSCLVHSRFPGLSGRPVRPSWLFFPLSTRVYQAHAEGRGCLPFTREAGVDWIPFHGIIDLHGYAVTKIKRLSPLSPHPCGWFRANRSHTKRAPDKWDASRARFRSIFLASSFFYISSIVHARPLAGNANR